MKLSEQVLPEKALTREQKATRAALAKEHGLSAAKAKDRIKWVKVKAAVQLFDLVHSVDSLRLLEALDRAVRAGVLYPRWFPGFAFGYGHPVLNFYGPLSYYWGLPFTLLGIDPALALKLVLAGGLIASALGMYAFARLHLGRSGAVAAAVVYAYLPYHLVDLYLRGALAEFLASS